MSNAYDQVPYESFPYPQTSPAHLYTVGKVFGMTAPDFKTAKVLELGCAAGGNLIPLAAQYKDAQFTGIDLSEKQIGFAREHVKNLGLANITFKAMSIMDITKAFGTFDYIICHGVFSWVPEAVQNKILKVCKENLNPQGLAVVSYNTLPGFNVIRSIREMMLYHTASFENPSEKVAQAKGLLTFITDSLEAVDTPYKTFVSEELKMLQQHNDSYILHDHLEDENNPVYLHQFMDLANQSGLQYLGDTSLQTMFSGNLSEKAIEVLKTANEQVRLEQYMDFITNRRFRQTVLCHQDVALNRNLSPDLFKDLFITSKIQLVKPLANIDLKKDEDVEFTGAVSLTTHSRVAAALFIELQLHSGYPLTVDELVEKAMARVDLKDSKVFYDTFNELGLRVLLSGGLQLHADRLPNALKISEKPTVLPIARYQAKQQTWLANTRNEPVNVDACSRLVALCLDGSNDLKSLKEKVLEQAIKGEVTFNRDGKALSSKEDIAAALDELLPSILENFARNALLVA